MVLWHRHFPDNVPRRLKSHCPQTPLVNAQSAMEFLTGLNLPLKIPTQVNVQSVVAVKSPDHHI